MDCFGDCLETPEGGVCDPCPEWFEGDGLTCRDIRVHCEDLNCPEACETHESGGICIPCPEYHTPNGNGLNCTDERIFCSDQIPGGKLRKHFNVKCIYNIGVIQIIKIIVDRVLYVNDRVSCHVLMGSNALIKILGPPAASVQKGTKETAETVQRYFSVIQSVSF